MSTGCGAGVCAAAQGSHSHASFCKKGQIQYDKITGTTDHTMRDAKGKRNGDITEGDQLNDCLISIRML